MVFVQYTIYHMHIEKRWILVCQTFCLANVDTLITSLLCHIHVDYDCFRMTMSVLWPSQHYYGQRECGGQVGGGHWGWALISTSGRYRCKHLKPGIESYIGVRMVYIHVCSVTRCSACIFSGSPPRDNEWMLYAVLTSTCACKSSKVTCQRSKGAGKSKHGSDHSFLQNILWHGKTF